MTHKPKKLRPHVWIVSDPKYHVMYHPWQVHKAQAHYRGELYALSFDDFAAIWGDDWDFRGRGGDDLILTRIDSAGEWSLANCELRIRKEHLKELIKQRQGFGASRDLNTYSKRVKP